MQAGFWTGWFGKWRAACCVECDFKSRMESVFPLRVATGPALACLKNAVWLLKILCSADKLIRRRGVEFEHVVVARNDYARANLFRQRRGFASVQVSRDTAF